MGASQRNKGKRGEREFLNALGKALGRKLERNLQQSDKGGADCLCVDGWAIEVKRWEDSSLPSWWRQAETQANRVNARPALAWRRNRQPWKVWLAKPGKNVQPITIEEFADLILRLEENQVPRRKFEAIVEGPVTPKDLVYLRITANGEGQVPGQFLTHADDGRAVNVSDRLEFASTTNGAGVAMLQNKSEVWVNHAPPAPLQ